MPHFEIGSLVRCREREWVVLPSPQEEVLLLRPLGGSEAEVCGIFLPVEGDAVQAAQFVPPDPLRAGDFVSGQLLCDAARLSLRSGAGPFRSLGRLGVRPRPYQLVPLIMALRLETMRLLIADDVGIGKTVEAGLIARELIDRSEIHRLTVLCPPHLCDQWQRELAEKFGIDAVVVRSSTAAALERALPQGDVSIFEHYPFTVASIDYVKSERRRDNFLRTCPELVIVDEAHTATRPGGHSTTQQQRYELVRDVAAVADRHLLLLTATPHSGVEHAFLGLVGLLVPRFEQFDMARLNEGQRDELARHFVQRRRADVQRWLGTDDVTPFPTREGAEITYKLARSSEYRKLFNDVYSFARELVRNNDASVGGRTSARQRVRYWAALALLRCVMSSPAAAERALRARAGTSADALDGDEALFSDDLFRSYVHDSTDQERAQDQEPSSIIEQGSGDSERTRLNRFANRAADLAGAGDPKLLVLVDTLEKLLRDSFNPIVYCRYIATANYLAGELTSRLKSFGNDLRVLAVTGERSEEEREALVAELEMNPRRLLVATDCLSEGINLQGAFDAVIHYDLPWNPNRLEQREGRVDRYGQQSSRVRTVLLYGEDNPIDAAVMQVLLRKAVNIHRTLGISVPLPVDSETVVEKLITSLFQPAAEQLSIFDTHEQLSLIDASKSVQMVEQQWNRAIEREKESRTRFAQRSIKPAEVARELEESDAVLGNEATVERFVRAACERLGATLVQQVTHYKNTKGTNRQTGREEGTLAPRIFALDPRKLPQPVRERIASSVILNRGKRDFDTLLLSFVNPAPSGSESVGRNHPLTAALADYLLETALVPDDGLIPAARSSLMRTRSVSKRTTVLLLRVRMLIEGDKRNAERSAPLLAEELVVCGYTGRPGTLTWLDEQQALDLLAEAQPDANVSVEERTMSLQTALDQIPALNADLRTVAEHRAERLRESHQRVRSVTGRGRALVKPHLPPDVLGVYVLLPTTVLSGARL